jgi:tetratricopeptide (TPR) repeat protein
LTDGAHATPPREPLTGRHRWLVPAIVAIVTMAAFSPALTADFVTWDDDTNFLRNSEYRGLGIAQLKWMWTTHLLGHYVPLAWMSLGLDFTLWGMDARGYHFTNIAIHAANAVLLFYVCRRLIGLALDSMEAVDGPSALAALLYAVHPLRVESVAWITERRDVLSTFFVLLAVLAYLKSSAESPFRRWYWMTLVAFTCAVLSKATAVTLPAVLFILNVYPLRSDRRRALRELAPMLAISAAAGLYSVIALEPGPQLPVVAKIAVSAYSLAFYIWKTVVPVGLAPLYEMPAEISPFEARFVIGYAVCAAFIVIALAARRRYPGVSAALAAFAVMIFPLLGIVQNGVQIAADRYTYQAMQPIAVLIAGALSLWWKRGTAIAAGVVVAILMGLTARQSTFWRNSETLWKRVIEIDPNASLARTALANVLAAENRLDEAIEQYQRSLSINPRSLEADNNLGMALTRQGRFEEAMVHYRRAIDINPEHYEAHNNLGVLLARQGNSAAAIEHFRRSVEIKRDFPDAEVNWGNALLRAGQPADAISHYARAVAISPRAPGAQFNWGVALAQQGRFAEAVPHFRAALAIDPADAAAAEALATAERLARGGK